MTDFCTQAFGNGLALAGVCIEQDAAYWEWHVEVADGKSEDTMFGVTTPKDRAFYNKLEEQDDGTYTYCQVWMHCMWSRASSH